MTFHNVVLAIHNITRWIILILAVLALVRAYSGWLGRRGWTERDRLISVLFTSFLDLQLLLGIILVLLAGIGNLGSLLYEHVIPMLVAVIFAHIGSARARKQEADADKFRQMAIWYTMAVLVVLVTIPWNRPLLPRL